MNYIQFLQMRPEISLLAIFVAVLIFDIAVRGRWRNYFHPFACIMLMLHTAVCVSESYREANIFGGMYYTNPMIGVVKTILTGGTLLLVFQANKWLRSPHTTHKQGEFYTLLLSTLFGMYIMISARHFLLFVIGLELASLPIACLVAFDKYRHHSAEAGVKYILSSMFSSAVMIYGISFLYGTTGTLYFEDMVTNINGSTLQIFALVLFFAGMGFKISLVPFHMWTADTYQGAPTVVSSYLSVISKGAAAFTLMVILMKVFAPMMKHWQIILYILTVASITVANLFAIRQTDLKRFMAYSSISQAGYIMLAVIGGSEDGMSALVFYVLVYIFANLAVFGVIETLEHHTGSNVLRIDCNGLYKTNPKLTLLMTLALFSLAGIPPFAGFFSKFFVFMSAFKAGFWVLVFIALINTVVSLYYYLLIVKAMYITPNEQPIEPFKSSRYSRISLVICLAGILLLGVCSFVFEEIDRLSFGM